MILPQEFYVLSVRPDNPKVLSSSSLAAVWLGVGVLLSCEESAVVGVGVGVVASHTCVLCNVISCRASPHRVRNSVGAATVLSTGTKTITGWQM